MATIALAAAILASAAFFMYLGWSLLRVLPSFGGPVSRTTVSHSLVMGQIQSVAKLISTETVMRDVVVYEDTWYGSTKRSLVVVTARVLAGIDLAKNPEVAIDEASHRIRILLPAAEILAVDVENYQTYDESRGLWNPFAPLDRDRIYQQARQKFVESANQSKVIEHANQGAKRLLEAMFTKDGFTAEVITR